MDTNRYFLTIDVGTKNLAICIGVYDTHNPNNSLSILERFNIINWDVIDVSYKPLYCKQIKNKRAICNCQSKFYSLKPNSINDDHANPDNLIGYCKSHAKLIRLFNKKKENKHNQIKLFTISSNPIYKNNFNTQMDKLLIGLEDYFNKNILSPYNYLDNKFQYIKNLDIYIENQPVFKNPVMKSISVGIYTFFLIKKIKYYNIINSVNFINATVKTKKNFVEQLGNLVGLKSQIKDFAKYANRKDFGEDIVGQIIPKLLYNQKYINNIFSTCAYFLKKKKDDMADTLLYQIYIIFYLI